MLFEIGISLATVGLIGTAAVSPKIKRSDRQKIDKIFKNLGIGVNDNGKPIYPKFLEKLAIQQQDGTVIGERYVYTLPLGLSGKKIALLEKEAEVFRQALKRPVTAECKDGYLHVKVFQDSLPDLFPYHKLPKPSEKWVVPIGVSEEGIVWHNFDHIPHMTIAGTTRFGKTVCLKTLTTYLIEHQPEDIELFVIDLKGGLEFGPYGNIRQIKGVASDPGQAYEMLTGIFTEIEIDMMNFRKQQWSNITETKSAKRKFIIVDEGAQLSPTKGMPKEEKELLYACQAALSEIARVAGALGYRLIFATQYPTADTLPRQIKQNADAKLSFRLPTGYASEVAIDEQGAEELPSDLKGRALFKTHKIVEVQVPYLSNGEMKRRLEVYSHGPIEYREEINQTGEYFKELS